MRDWQGLARKIASGKPLEDAAAEAGIPFGEVIAHAKERMAMGDALPWQLRLVGQRALQTAMDRLETIAGDGPRDAKEDSDTDRHAATALARLGIAALKLAKDIGGARRGRNDPDPSQPDLFDRGPWDLTQPGR